MATEEVSFLKDQVYRLNHELVKYRQHRLEIEDQAENVLPSEGPPPPWLTNKSLLSPLVAEYDAHIKEQQQLISEYEDELQGLRPELARLVQENERLNDRLKDTVHSQLESTGGAQTAQTEPIQTDEQMVQNMQFQLDAALQEKDVAIEKWHEAEVELDRLQGQLQEEKHSHQWGAIEQQAHQMQSEYFETVNLLNRELEQVQQDFRQTRHELETSNLQVKDLRRTNKELEQQINWKDQEVAEVIFKEGITDSKVGELKRIMDDLRKKISVQEIENEELRREKSGLEVRVGEMQKRNTDVSNREMEAVQQMREAVQMVETAAIEKEQAEISQQQKEEELEQLREVINKLINEAGARTRQEVDAVRNQSNDRIKKLTEEVHVLEMDNSEKQDSLEKALRDKRAAESELERTTIGIAKKLEDIDLMYKDGVAHMNKEMGDFELMNKRAIAAERARDEANMQVETLQHKVKKEELNSQQLKEQLEAQLNGTRERLSQLQLEFENSNDDRIRLLDEVDELKKRLQSAQQEKESAQRKYHKEITIFEQDNNMKLRDYEVKLQSTEDCNRHTMSELRKLLSGQQRMCAKWKEECHNVSQKYEIKLTETRSEMAQLKKRNNEVTKLLKDSQQKTSQAEKMIQDYTRNIQRMEQRMRDSEMRAADATKQLSRQAIRGKQMESEKRILTQELKRSTMEASTRSNRGQPDELLIGDLAASQKSNSSFRRKGEIDDFLEDR